MENPDEEIKDYLSINEFAELLNVHPNTVRKGIKSGRINGFRIGPGASTFRIPRTEIQRLSYLDLEKLIQKKVEEQIREIQNKSNEQQK